MNTRIIDESLNHIHKKSETLESFYGTDKRKNVCYIDLISAPTKWIGKIEMMFNGEWYDGNCCKLNINREDGGFVILTAGHCLYDRKEKCYCSKILFKFPGKKELKADISQDCMFVPEEYIAKKQNDIGVIWGNSINNSCKYFHEGGFGFKCNDDVDQIADEAFISRRWKNIIRDNLFNITSGMPDGKYLQHSGGLHNKPLEFLNQTHSVFGNYLMSKNNKTPLNAVILHDIHTTKGQSGSPLWCEDKRYGYVLVGIHVRGGLSPCGTYNKSTPLTVRLLKRIYEKIGVQMPIVCIESKTFRGSYIRSGLSYTEKCKENLSLYQLTSQYGLGKGEGFKLILTEKGCFGRGEKKSFAFESIVYKNHFIKMTRKRKNKLTFKTKKLNNNGTSGLPNREGCFFGNKFIINKNDDDSSYSISSVKHENLCLRMISVLPSIIGFFANRKTHKGFGSIVDCNLGSKNIFKKFYIYSLEYDEFEYSGTYYKNGTTDVNYLLNTL